MLQWSQSYMKLNTILFFFSFGRKDYQRLDKSDLEIIHSSIESE